jgi:hypothetical protein
LRDERMAYCTLAGRKKWQGQNNMWGMLIALFLTLLACGAALGLALEFVPKKQAPGAAARREDDPPARDRFLPARAEEEESPRDRWISDELRRDRRW